MTRNLLKLKKHGKPSSNGERATHRKIRRKKFQEGPIQERRINNTCRLSTKVLSSKIRLSRKMCLLKLRDKESKCVSVPKVKVTERQQKLISVNQYDYRQPCQVKEDSHKDTKARRQQLGKCLRRKKCEMKISQSKLGKQR